MTPMGRAFRPTASLPIRLVLLAGLCLPLRGPAAAHPRTVRVGGVQRDYLLVVPAACDGKESVPMLLVFHGKGATGALEERITGFSELAEKKGFLAVYPEGLEHEWNGGRTSPVSSPYAQSDDVAFVSALIDQLESLYPIDSKRIFATGSSNGAIFCYTLAARLSERIAAIGPVSGSLGELIPKRFRPMFPVSVISFNGTDDPLVPYAGRADFGEGTLSIPASIAFWVSVDGCNPHPTVSTDKPSTLDPGLSVIRLRYSGGANRCEVLALVIGHGGPTWPGARPDPAWAKIAGKTAMSINASELIWAFFENHPKL